jgi:hypothetical protein
MNVETSLNWPALGQKNMTSLEGWPDLLKFLCKELFSRDFKNWSIFREGQFSEVRFREVSLYLHVSVCGDEDDELNIILI